MTFSGAGSSLPVTSMPWRRREAVVALLDQPCHVQACQIVVLVSDDLDADGQAERQPDRRNGRGQVIPAGTARPEELIDDRLGPAVDGDRPVMALARLIVRESRRRRGGAEQQIMGLEPLFPADHELVATFVPPEPVPVRHGLGFQHPEAVGDRVRREAAR